MWTKVFLPIILFHAYTVISFPNQEIQRQSKSKEETRKGQSSEETPFEAIRFKRTNTNAKRTVTNPNCKCGREFLQRKIVNGIPTKVHEYTWMAALVRNGEKHPFCGGSLINNQYILTAAHCIDSVKPHEIVVKLLEHDVEKEDTIVVTAKVASIIKHPEYTYYFDYDVALLRLKSPLVLTEGSQIEPKLINICLPTDPIHSNNLYEDQRAIVTGWGKVATDGSVSPILQHVNLTIEKDDTCKANYPKGDITPRMMCAKGHVTEGSTRITDSCNGDSGGPLMVNVNGKYLQVGIVSWGSHEGCGNDKKPGVYTRVTEILPWINENTLDGEACSNSLKGTEQ